MKVSIIITNYDYGRFLPACIESALTVRWPRKEIIVVDDGSTDESANVIERYRGRVTVVLKPNGGQCSAANAGMQHATGDIVFFVDADDMLMPNAAEKVAAVWRPDVSKVQFPMAKIDRDGNSLGGMYPAFPPKLTPKRVKEILLRTGIYPTSPTTGNAWGKEFLAKIFPVPEDYPDVRFFDNFLLVTAPLYGDVLTLYEPLAWYRLHGGNTWAEFAMDKLSYYCRQDLGRTRYLIEQAAMLGIVLPPRILDCDYRHMMSRIACRRFDVAHYPYPNDSIAKVTFDCLEATWRSPAMSRIQKALLSIWFVSVGLMPMRVADEMTKLRFVPDYRPRLIRKVMRTFGFIRGDATA